MAQEVKIKALEDDVRSQIAQINMKLEAVLIQVNHLCDVVNAIMESYDEDESNDDVNPLERTHSRTVARVQSTRG